MRTAAHVQARRDAVLAVLRDADEPINMREVLRRLNALASGRPVSYNTAWSVVYNDLRVLDRQGRADWLHWSHPENPTRGVEVTFRIKPGTESPDLDELEAMWEVSP